MGAFARMLVAAGEEVHIIALRLPGEADAWSEEHLRVESIGPAPVMPGLVRGAWIMGDALRRARHAHRERPFQLVLGVFAREPGRVALAFARAHGLPGVVALGGTELASPEIPGSGLRAGLVDRADIGLSLTGADRLVVPSNEMLGRLDALAPSLLPRAVVLPWPVPRATTTRTRVRMDPAAPRIAVVAGHVPLKDPLAALELLARLRTERPRATLELMGAEGSLTGALRARARALDLREAVRIGSFLPHDALLARLAEADVILQTTRFEAFGAGVLEGMAHGCVPCGTHVGILGDLARQLGRTGPDTIGTAAPGDVSGLFVALREALGRLDRDPLSARTRARDLAAAFTPARLGPQWRALFQSLARAP